MHTSITRSFRKAALVALVVLLAGCTARTGDPAEVYGDDVPPYDDELPADGSSSADAPTLYEEGDAEGSASEALFGEVILPTSDKCASDYPEYASRMRDVALREPAEGYFATAPGGDILFDRTYLDDREKLALVDLGGGEVGLIDRNCKFLSAIGGGGGVVVADKHWLGTWERFDITKLSNQRVQLRTQSGYYLFATPRRGLSAGSTSTRALILVELEDTRQVAIQAGPMLNGHDPRLVTVDGDRLEFGRRLGNASTFDLLELGLGEVAFRSRQSGAYLRACSGGGSCVRADRYRLAGHERFEPHERAWFGSAGIQRVRVETANHHWLWAANTTLTAYADYESSATDLYLIDVRDAPQTALYSTYKYRYVRAEPDGDLKADAPAIDFWEKYRVIERGSDSAGRRRIALRNHHGRYLRAAGGGGGRLVADAWHADTHETFTVMPAGDGQIALRTHNGRYIRVQPSNDLSADAYGAGTASLFRFVTPPQPAIIIGTVGGFSL